MPPTEEPTVVCIPMKLDAFVIPRPDTANIKSPLVHLLPFEQVNYSALRLDPTALRADLQDHVDFRHTNPTSVNPRLYDLSTGTPRENVSGVYVSWVMPRVFRTEMTETQTGLKTKQVPCAPNRWLVVRAIEGGDTFAPSPDAWIVESDACFHIDDLGEDTDLQLDVSQYLAATPGSAESGARMIEKQAEYFIGQKMPCNKWSEERKDLDPNEKKLRVKPLVANSAANVLFADYQPHNNNVFSILDPMKYAFSKYYINYFVLGWYSDGDDDLFTDKNESTSLMDSLQELGLDLDGLTPRDEATQKKLNSRVSRRTLVHGCLYNPEVDPWCERRDNPSTPGQQAAQDLIVKQCVGFGSGPLDSILAVIRSQSLDRNRQSLVYRDIIALVHLVHARNSRAGVSEQAAAKEELEMTGFASSFGGIIWHTTTDQDQRVKESRQSGPPLTDKEVQTLNLLNDTQWAQDNAERTIERLRWELFAAWWKFVSSFPSSKEDYAAATRTDVDHTVKQIRQLVSLVTDLKKEIKLLSSQLPKLTKGSLPMFYQRKDPTVSLAGLSSQWPPKFTEKLKVRVASQICSNDAIYNSDMEDSSSGKKRLDTLYRDISTRLPFPYLQSSAMKLLQEFHVNWLRKNQNLPLFPGTVKPFYHDEQKSDIGASGEAPIIPLFIEWEAEYTHIPFEFWEETDQYSEESESFTRLQATIRQEIPLSQHQFPIKRTVSGRSFILPTPTESLAGLIDRLFASIPSKILDEQMPQADRDALRKSVSELPFLSAPLAGLGNHLATVIGSTSHIVPSSNGKAVPEARAAASSAGFTNDVIRMMGSAVDPLPYGDLIELPKTDKVSPFVPVTHGQLRISKLNVIDKFGRGINLLDLGPDTNATSIGFPNIYLKYLEPCLSPIYQPQAKENQPNVPNVVNPVNQLTGRCQFAQLPPTINQPSRLNGSFVTQQDNKPKSGNTWRPANEFENPVWGWIVYNSMEMSILIFLPDGTFFRELRVGGIVDFNSDGRMGDTDSSGHRWWPSRPRPFDADQDTTGEDAHQLLKRFVSQLVDSPSYARCLVDVLADATATMNPTKSSYADSLNSILGKPYALVHMGWSLELADSPRKNQSTLATGSAERNLEQYHFGLKIGSGDRDYDGLVGYFPVVNGSTNFETLHTYWPSVESSSPDESNAKNHTKFIHAGDLPKLKPFHLDPISSAGVPRNVSDITKSRNDKLLCFGCIVDPFIAVSGYTTVLPAKRITIPQWAVNFALSQMTYFFRIGPILATTPVAVTQPEKLPSNAVRNTRHPLLDQTISKSPLLEEPPMKIQVPAPDQGNWEWLQPVLENGENKFEPFTVAPVDDEARFDIGPYTLVEGILSTKEPLLKSTL